MQCLQSVPTYIEKIKQFIRTVIDQKLSEKYLCPWDKDDFSSEDQKYITPDMGQINTKSGDFYYSNFSIYIDNYTNLVKWYREPSGKEYHMLLCKLDKIFGMENVGFFPDNFEIVVGFIVYCLARSEIDNYNKDKKLEIRKIIKKRKEGVLTIQKIFRKYRYNPEFRFCRLVQMRGLLNLGCIDIQEFEKYLTDQNIYTSEKLKNI